MSAYIVAKEICNEVVGSADTKENAESLATSYIERNGGWLVIYKRIATISPSPTTKWEKE